MFWFSVKMYCYLELDNGKDGSNKGERIYGRCRKTGAHRAHARTWCFIIVSLVLGSNGNVGRVGLENSK